MANFRSSAQEELSATLSSGSFYVSPNHNAKIMSEIFQSFRSGHFTDVTLIAGDVNIKAHRLILSSVSQYFSAMFNSGLLESRSEAVTLNGIDGNVLKDLVMYCYTGRIYLHIDTVDKLFSTSSFLGFLEVLEAASNFLASQLQPENFIGIAMFAELHNCTRLQHAAMQYITEKFVSVIHCGEFELLSRTHMINILLSDNLNVQSEISVFEAVMKWVNIGSPEENRMDHLSTLLQYVKLPLLQPDYLKNIVAPQVGSEGAQFVSEAIKYYRQPRERNQLLTFRTTPRKSMLPSVIAIGGSNIPGAENIEVFNLRRNNWKFYGPLPKTWKCPRTNMAVVSCDFNIYVAGGIENQNTLRTFIGLNHILRHSLDLPDMLTPRHGLGLVMIERNSLIYAIGGHDGQNYLRSVERYDGYINKWCYVEQLACARSTAGVAVLNNQIYAIGGRNRLGCLNSVEVYSPCTDTWTFSASMNKCRGGVAAAVLNDYIYVLGGYGLSPSTRYSCVERYDAKENRWTFVAQLDVARDSIGAVVLGNYILAAGGFTGRSYLQRVDLYDPDKDEWTQLSDMEVGRAGPFLTTAELKIPMLF